MEKNIDRTPGKIIRGVGVTISSNCPDDEINRITKKVVRAYFNEFSRKPSWYLADIECATTVSNYGQNGMRTIRVELCEHEGSRVIVDPKMHLKIMNLLNDGGMSDVHLLHDDVIIHTKGGITNLMTLRVGYLAVTISPGYFAVSEIRGRVRDISMHCVVSVFKDRYAHWFMGEVDPQHSMTVDELITKLTTGKINVALCLKELLPSEPILLKKGIIGCEFLVGEDCFMYLKKAAAEKR